MKTLIILLLVTSVAHAKKTETFRAVISCSIHADRFAGRGKAGLAGTHKELLDFCEEALMVELMTDHEALFKIRKFPEVYGCVAGVVLIAKGNNKDMTKEMIAQTAANFCKDAKAIE